jgi:hypothetical protein
VVDPLIRTCHRGARTVFAKTALTAEVQISN